MTLFPQSPFRGGRRVIDISGDGSNNPRPPGHARARRGGAAGVGINGLPILALEPDLDRYYRDYVIGGPGAFVIAKDLRDLRRRYLEKADHRDCRHRWAAYRPLEALRVRFATSAMARQSALCRAAGLR